MESESFPYVNPSIPKYAIPQFGPYNPYDESGVQKTELFVRSNNEVCNEYKHHYVHAAVDIAAETSGKSVNQWALETFEKASHSTSWFLYPMLAHLSSISSVPVQVLYMREDLR